MKPIQRNEMKLKCGVWIVLNVGLLLGAYLLHNPYLGFFVTFLLGFNTLVGLSKEKIPLSVVLTLSPAVGITLLVLTFYVASHVEAGLLNASLVYTTLFVISPIFLCIPNRSIEMDIRETLGVILTTLTLFMVHFFAYIYPTDNVDNYFHATKIAYILKYNSMFPHRVPNFNMITYPGGYHSTTAYLSIITGAKIPDAMLAIRSLSWILLALGLYLFSRFWLGKKTALYPVISIISTNIVYYYLLVYIQPNFVGFYFFLTMLAISYAHMNGLPEREAISYYPALGALIGATALLVHPYSFQNYALVLSFYTLLSRGRRLLSDGKNIATTAIIYGLLPIAIYILLNPYFWFPSLAHPVIEFKYPWTTFQGITTKNLAVFQGRALHDTWSFFKFMWKWATVRNLNYAGFLFLLSSFYYLIRGKRRAETASLILFLLLVLGLNVDRLTINVPVPFYSTAAMEREFLWLVPVFPVLIGLGLKASSEILNGSGKSLLHVLYVLLIATFFLVPAYGNAIDLVSDEANFYVTPDVLEDFSWIAQHHTSANVVGSCTSDSSVWLPFFESGKYRILTDPYFRRCHVGNQTIVEFVRRSIESNRTFPNTIAYIDTNAPSLNPLMLLKRYKLLRINGNNWIYDLSSTNTSKNMKIAKDALRLCSSIIPGDMDKWGRYYVWGFTKKYFYVRYLKLKGIPMAFLQERTGLIAFAPCRGYRSIRIELITSRKMSINVTVNGELVLKNYQLSRGFDSVIIKTPVPKGTLNVINITKSRGTLLIRFIELEGNK